MKIIRDMTAKLQDRYKTMQCMWTIITNDAWKIFLVKNIESENFSVAIDRTSIESGRLKPKILIAISIDQKTSSIDRKSGKIRFLKNIAF